MTAWRKQEGKGAGKALIFHELHDCDGCMDACLMPSIEHMTFDDSVACT